MKCFFKLIEEAAYHVGEMRSIDELKGVVVLPSSRASVLIQHSLEKVEILEFSYDKRKGIPQSFPADDFCDIFLKMLRHKKTIFDIENAENRRWEHERRCIELQPVNYAGSMAGY
jgi:hypothetical protein